jgi:DNA-binding winged helix-turn-helix (wHTH) protein
MREQTEHRCCVFRFADVEVREREFSILRSGKILPVEPKAYKVLKFLLRNPGRVIPKDELLDAVWNDSEVSESSLTRSIAMLRRLLGDDSREPRYIATVPTVGYRFVCDVEVSENPPDDLTALPPPAASEGRPSKVPVERRLWLTAAALVVVTAALSVWWSLPGQPTIESVSQLTDDGNPKLSTSALLSDGYRIYFNELRAGSSVIAQVAVGGGETGQIISRIPSPTLAALAMDSSSLLALGESYFFGSLWLLPLPAGEPRQLRNVVAQNASFTPDGHLIFSKDASLCIAEKDGSKPRKLRDLPSHISGPVVSPDGRRIRLTVEGSYTKSLWEVDSDGNNAHPLLPGWQAEGAACCGRWTSDGKYFVFQSRSQSRTDLWAIREGNRWLARSSSPLRLTNGPLSYELPVPSPDGKHLFAIGLKPRGN